MMTPVWFQKTICKRNSRTQRRFFTLMELVAATGIMMSVAAVIAFASFTFYKSLASAEKVSEHLKTMVAIDQVMDTCFRNMIPFTWQYNDSDYNDDTNLVFLGEEDYIHFTTLRRSYDEQTGCLFFMRMYVDNDDQLVAEYSKYPRLPWVDDMDEMPYETEVITTNVDEIYFLYAGIDNDQETLVWLDYWDRESYNFIPHAVQLTIKWKDGTEESWLRRTAASGGNSVYGALQTIDE